MIFKLLKRQIGLNKTIVINMSSTILLQGVAFFTIPIFTRVLGTEQYGLYSVFNSWVLILSLIMPFGLSNCNNWGQYYFKNEYNNFRSSIIIYNYIVSMVFCLIFLMLYNKINILFEYSFKLYVVLLLSSFSTNIIGAVSGFLVFEKKALLNFFISVFLSILNVILSLYLIFNFKFDNLYEGRVYGHYLPYVILSLVILVYILLKNRINLKFEYIKCAFLFGGPIVFHSLANIILGQSDRVMMQKMNVANSDIGIYSLFYSFVGVLSIILSGLNISFSPFYVEYIEKNDKDIIIIKSKNFIEIFTVVCIGFLLLSREVSYFMANDDYYRGIKLIPIFVGTIYFIFMYQFAVNYEFFYRRTTTIAGGTICAALLNILLNLFFIKRLGMYGAAYATIISYFALYVFHYFIAYNMKEKRFYLSIRYYLIGIILIIVFSYIFYLLSNFAYVRWTLGVLIGTLEIYRIYIRKSIF